MYFSTRSKISKAVILELGKSLCQVSPKIHHESTKDPRLHVLWKAGAETVGGYPRAVLLSLTSFNYSFGEKIFGVCSMYICYSCLAYVGRRTFRARNPEHHELLQTADPQSSHRSSEPLCCKSGTSRPLLSSIMLWSCIRRTCQAD